MRQLGIWLDSDRAVIIDYVTQTLINIESEVEHFHLRGGSRSKAPYGPQEVASESKLLERKKHQMRSYFQNLCEKLGDYDELVVFGPAETKIEFSKFIHSGTDSIKLKSTENADNRFTDNQLIEWVRNYFG